MRPQTLSALAMVLAAVTLASPRLAAENTGPVIWYRSSEGCPDGAAFVGRLRGAAAGSKLAEVGDPIDFVVTLGKNGSVSSGKLERQTSSGIVAVRTIESESCLEVADVLALTLTLALDPNAPVERSDATSPESAPPSGSTFEDADTVPETSMGAAPEPPRQNVGSRSSRVDSKDPKAAPKSTDPKPSWLLGAHAGLTTGLAPDPALLVALFAELEPRLAWLPEASTRFTLGVNHADGSLPSAVRWTSFAGRLEACPIDLLDAPLSARPCLGLELGLARAERRSSAGQTDNGLWAAATLNARLSWLVGGPLSFEAQAGALLPLIRYELRSTVSDHVLYRTESLGFSAALGAAFRL